MVSFISKSISPRLAVALKHEADAAKGHDPFERTSQATSQGTQKRLTITTNNQTFTGGRHFGLTRSGCICSGVFLHRLGLGFELILGQQHTTRRDTRMTAVKERMVSSVLFRRLFFEKGPE